MEILGLLFDLDGTLIHTQEANMRAYNIGLSEYGLQFTPEQYTSTTGMDSNNFLTEFFPHLTKAEIDDVRRIKSSVYNQFLPNTYLNKDLFNLATNSLKHKRLGIVTTGKKVNVLEVLDFHRIANMFQIIVTGDDVKSPKPSPEPYLKGIEMLGLHRAQILVFEDSQIGCESATSAGLSVFKVNNWLTNED